MGIAGDLQMLAPAQAYYGFSSRKVIPAAMVVPLQGPNAHVGATRARLWPTEQVVA